MTALTQWVHPGHLDMVLAHLLAAAAGSLAAGAAVWAVAVLCSRRLPALARQRMPWLAGQVAVATVFLAMLLPTSERLHVTPVIEMDEPAPTPAATASAPAREMAGASANTPAPGHAPRHAWLRDAARAWCVLYLLGLGHALLRWRRALRLLDGLAAGGLPLAAPQGHPGLAAYAQAGLPAVIEVDAPVAPMLQGVRAPRLLLPRHLRSFDPLQQRLIVEHELTHWRRRDLHWSAVSLLLQSLFWFNPFMRLLHARLGWAQEFGCDRDVLRGRPQGERKAYAAALVAQLKLQQAWRQQPAGTVLAFGAGGAGGGAPTLAMRIGLIRTPVAGSGAWPRCVALAGLAAVGAANLALQPTLSWRGAGAAEGRAAMLANAWPAALSGTAAPLDCTLMVDAASGATVVREGSCDAHVTPASTFKIAISLMGFDSGVLQDARTPVLPYRASYASANPATRHDTDPAGWLRESAVWYSQQVTARLGAAAIRRYVQAFGYGNGDLASVAGVDDAIALSEVSPTLRISPREQTVFLRKVVNRTLPLSAHAYDMTARLLDAGTPTNGWTVYGKTGTASVRRPDGSADADEDIGWYVGWIVRDGRTLVFARLLQRRVDNDHYAGALTRAAFLGELARRAL